MGLNESVVGSRSTTLLPMVAYFMGFMVFM